MGRGRWHRWIPKAKRVNFARAIVLSETTRLDIALIQNLNLGQGDAKAALGEVRVDRPHHIVVAACTPRIHDGSMSARAWERVCFPG